MIGEKKEEYVPPDVIDEEEAAANAYQNICDDGINRIRTKAAKIPQGHAGTCEVCNEWKERIVSVVWRGAPAEACAKCRDDFKLG